MKSLPDSLFPLEEWSQGRPLHTVLRWPGGGGAVWSACSHFFPSVQSILVSVVRGVLQPHPHALGFSQGCVVNE